MCSSDLAFGILNPKRTAKNLGRMWEDTTPVGMIKRSADRRNKVKDQNRERDELKVSRREARRQRIAAYEAQNSGLNIT